MLKRFKSGDIFYNRIKTYPECKFFFYSGSIYYNEKPRVTGSNTGSVYPDIGKIDLYENNIDRQSGQFIYPFITKNGSLTAFKTVSTSDFNSDFSYGDTITGSYPLEAGLVLNHYAASATRAQIDALQNVLDFYKPLSQHYAYSSSHGDKSTQEISQIDIPSIFYGSSIRKGSVLLQFHSNGILVGELRDEKRNGELIQTAPSGSTGSGSVAGVVLYNEGIIILTGSWTL